MKDKVTCIILNYNDAVTTINMVKRISNYSIFNYILIIDNKSTDDSFRELKEKLNRYKNVIIKSTLKNGGYGFGNNFGIKYAHKYLDSKYAIVSNPDVYFSEQLVKDMIILMHQKGAALVSGTQKVNGKVIKEPAWKLPTAIQWALVETRLNNYVKKSYYYSKSFFQAEYSKVDCVRGAMFLIDVNKFLSVNGYDDRMFLFGEETLIGFKFKQKNYSTYILNHEFYDHVSSTTINKEFPNIIKQTKISHQSKYCFAKYYLKSNAIILFIMRFIFNTKILKMRINQLLYK